MPKNIRRLEAQLRAASSRRSSKIIRDADSIEAVEVMGWGTLTLSVQSGGGYSLRARPEKTDDRGQEAAGRDLVAVGVLGAEEVVSVVPR